MNKLFAIVLIILMTTGICYAKKPGDWVPPGHRDTNAVASATSESFGIGYGYSNVNLDWKYQFAPEVTMPVKWHSDEISPRDPATYEGPWPKESKGSTYPWLINKVNEGWTMEDVADFPKGNIKIVSGLFKKAGVVNSVKFTRPPQNKGINKAGTIRIICKDPECGYEDIHRKSVETAYEKGIAYLFVIDKGESSVKTGGDWSARIGGGGGGITGDGGVSGGGGFGGGRYWVGPGVMPWVLFEAWVYYKEGI